MKAMVLHRYGELLRAEEVPMPEPGDHEVLVRVRYCGICGTDLKIVDGKLPGIITLPHVLGHEIAGEVAAAGAQVRGLAVGEPGIVYMYVPCHDCELCRTGRENICVSIKRLGFEYAGGFSQYVKLPAYNFCPVSRSSPLQQMAVLTDAVATPYHALKRIAGLQHGQSVLIVGAGGLGLHAVQLARLAGARVAAVDLRAEALRQAQEYGAELAVDPAHGDPRERVMRWTAGVGVDVVLEGVGIDATVSWSLLCLKRGGTLVLVGYDPQHPITVDTKEMHYNEWRIAGTRAATKQDLLELISLTERGELKPLVTAVMPLEEVNSGLAEVRRGTRVGRIVIQVG
jgi:2-desacetyl-2-hydroxyethyl bacteriochlorophyllide A dehydrogenase